jgi:hypothetical protein
MSLRYEPSSEPLHISAKQLNREIVQLRPFGAPGRFQTKMLTGLYQTRSSLQVTNALHQLSSATPILLAYNAFHVLMVGLSWSVPAADVCGVRDMRR